MYSRVKKRVGWLRHLSWWDVAMLLNLIYNLLQPKGISLCQPVILCDKNVLFQSPGRDFSSYCRAVFFFFLSLILTHPYWILSSFLQISHLHSIISHHTGSQKIEFLKMFVQLCKLKRILSEKEIWCVVGFRRDREALLLSESISGI